MSSAFIAGLTVKVAGAGSPSAYAAVEEVISMSNLGKTNPLVDVTSFDSTAKEYIAGLADGVEITLECNYYPGATNQTVLKNNVDSGTNTNMQVLIDDGSTSPITTFTFTVVPLSWVITPQVEDRNTITFTLKITGAIT